MRELVLIPDFHFQFLDFTRETFQPFWFRYQAPLKSSQNEYVMSDIW